MPLLICIITSLPSTTAQRPGKYWITFKDKAGTPYDASRPAAFLSARALERRARAGISVTEEDLPVSPVYVKAVQATGAVLHGTSKWLNAVSVVADSATAAALRRLPFTDTVQYVGKHLLPRNPRNRPAKKRTSWAIPKIKTEGREEIPLWGYAGAQNAMLGVPTLHQAGHRGEGIWIAVMDGGYTNVDTMPFFDSLALNGRLFEGHDFVERDRSVFESASHGTSVLSVMGANLPRYYVGTAPDATYFLLKTEDTGGEFPIEEINWIAGAEWADSIGVDIVNASLGYTGFNDPKLSHTYRELDGRTAIGSRGAAIAARKGMIVFNSAGNEGDNPWRYIGVPADAPGVIGVGAVEASGAKAGFSSIGPTADGRIKPDLAAPGDQVVTAGYSGTALGVSSGTSLASPMLAGGVASLWSAFPEKNAAEIMDAVFASADQYTAPDTARGYGLPDLANAWLHLGGYATGGKLNHARPGVFAFDRVYGKMRICTPLPVSDVIQKAYLEDITGKKYEMPVSLRRHELTEIVFNDAENLPPGHYRAVIVEQNRVNTFFTVIF